MDGECLIDLDDNQPVASQAPLNNDIAAVGAPQASHAAAGHGPGTAAAAAATLGLPPSTQQRDPAQQHHSSVTSLQAAAERAARTGDILQKHSMEQGESNAKLRLLLATVAAKQVKARKMLAELSNEFTTAVAQSHSSSMQQVHDLTAQLQQAHQQAAAAQAEAERQRQLAAQQAELAQLRENQLQEARAELKAFRKAESRLRHELRDKESRLLEAQAALSRLSAELPGSRQLPAATLDTLSDDGSSAMGSSVVSTPAGGADAAADTADSGALLLTPVGDASKRGGGQAGVGAVGAGGAVGGTHKGLSIMTPDQAAAVQLKDWLDASQKALMEAHEDLLAKEAEIRQLRKQVQQQGAPPQPGEQQEQQQLQEQGGAAAVEPAADSQQGELVAELDSLRSEMLQLRLQLEAADAARADAVAALEALQQQHQQQQQQQEQPEARAAHAAAAAAAAERTAAAEAELQTALAAAAEASAEVQSLQAQLAQLQLQQQQAVQQDREPPGDAGVAAAAAAPKLLRAGDSELTATAAAAGQDSPGGDLELLQAQSRIHVLQEELQDTQETMRLLLGLVRKCAAAAAAAMAAAGKGKGASTAGGAEALSGEEQQQLQRMLAAVPAGSNGEAAATQQQQGGAADSSSDAKAAAAAAGPQLELGLLHGLLLKLECRYSMPKPLQDVVLRGREMEHLLATALQRVHAVKAEAGGGPCACPTAEDYRTAGKGAAAAGADAAQHAAGAGAAVSQPHEQLLPGFAVIDTAAGLEGAQFGSIMQSSNNNINSGWAQGPGGAAAAAAAAAGEGYGMVSESSISAGGHSGAWDSWDGQASAQLSEAGQGMGGSCYTGAEALRGFSADSSEAGGAGAVGSGGFGGAAVGVGGAAGLAPIVDENLGYDGLEGAWWAKSSIEPVTELPDFLVKKSPS